MRVIGERFLEDGASGAVDLATLHRVALRLLPRGSPAEEMAWSAECAATFDRAESTVECLVDYGVADDRCRFEATSRRLSTKKRAAPGSPAAAAELNGFAAELAEQLDGSHRPGVRALELRVSTRELLEPVWWLAARLARVQGYAPVVAEAFERWPWLANTLMSRHVVVFDPPVTLVCARDVVTDRMASLVLALGRASPRSHLILRPRVSNRVSWACRRVDLVAVDLPAGSGRTAPHGEATPPGPSPGRVTLRAASLVREMPESYGPIDRSPRAVRVRLKVARGLEASSRGRHAAGHRLLRDAIGGLDRRGERVQAAEAAMALGRLLQERGRTRDAFEAFEGATRRFGAAGHRLRAAAAQTCAGLVATDEARLREAEAMLRSALLVAQTADSDVRDQASVALARCLLWQRRYAEATRLVADLRPASPWQSVIRLRLLARLALGRLDLPSAGRFAWAALEAAVAHGDPVEVSGCHAVVAVVESRAGNVRGLRAHVAEGLKAARLAQATQRAWRLRLALIEGLLHVGERAAARTAAVRLARRSVERCPALLRARTCRTLLDALPESTDVPSWRTRVRAAIRDQGAIALDVVPAEVPCMDVIEELIEVLAVCQETDEERARLTGVCDVVRERLQAASVSLLAGSPAGQTLAEAGRVRSGRSEIGSRITETGLLIPPARSSHGLEAGAPVRYGGQVVAALTCRWSLDQSPDRPRVEALLATAAAACAPSVRSALDRLLVPPRPARSDDLQILGVSQAAEVMRAAVVKAAAAPFPILVEGESGSGKEVVARAIHRTGPRRDRRFAALNCAALNDELIEAELFGHARGAFTGALHERVGLFEEASGGTLFLDEVSELSVRAQAKLLRTLQEGEIRRVGENFTRRVDVRVVAATNRDLWADVRAGRFRQDLLYRLDVVRLAVPPLRARVEDIGLLAAHFWAQSTGRLGSRATLTPEVLAALAAYDWPGNVRELQNVMAALAVAAPPRGRVGVARLPPSLARHAPVAESTAGAETLEQARRGFERQYVQAAMARAGGHQGRAAASLGLTRQGLAKLVARLDVG